MVKNKKEHDNIIKHSHNHMLSQIYNFRENCTENHTEYIAALSQYMCISSDAYQYNLSYLISKNEEFQSFLRNAKRKCDNLEKLLKQLAETRAAQELQIHKPAEYRKVKVLFNNFLVGTLDGSISLDENYSIFGATCNDKNDTFTVSYKAQRRSGYTTLNPEDLEDLVESVLSVVEESGTYGEIAGAAPEQ